MNAWHTQHEDEISEIIDPQESDVMGAIITRLGEYIIKLSALYEVDSLLSKKLLSNLSTSPIIISVDSTMKSIAIIDILLSKLKTKLLNLLSSSYLSRSLVKLTKILENAKEEWVERQYVLPRMNMNTKQFDVILKTAYESGLVEIKEGRPQLIRLVKKPL